MPAEFLRIPAAPKKHRSVATLETSLHSNRQPGRRQKRTGRRGSLPFATQGQTLSLSVFGIAAYRQTGNRDDC
jgi:hypothetical protein